MDLNCGICKRKFNLRIHANGVSKDIISKSLNLPITELEEILKEVL